MRKKNKIVKISVIVILIFMIISPFVLWLFFGVKLFDKEELDIAIGITPLIGLLSAYIIYLSFLTQKNTSEFQFQTNRYESDLQFIYYRLTEIHKYNSNEEYKEPLKFIKIMINFIEQQNSDGVDARGNLIEIKKMEEGKLIELSFTLKYLDLYLIIKRKIKEINTYTDIDKVQLAYINSSLYYEYTSVLSLYIERLLIPQIENFLNNKLIEKNLILNKIYEKCISIKEMSKEIMPSA